ncbi:MAG: hypothetical protein P8Z49_10905 [Acidobacteriota bacterium]|jgi:hypothetical protein
MLERSLTEEQLWSKLPTLQGEDLVALLAHPSASQRHIIKVLQRRELPEVFLRRVAGSEWIRSTRIKFFFVNHPGAPLAEAMNFVKFLFWRDLNYTTMNFLVATEVRHLAESVLIQRLQSMAVGEKITLARQAGGQILKRLRHEKDPRVVSGLLENPRIVEDDVLFIVNQARTPAPILESIARDAKWATRREVQVSLLRNGNTPLSAVIGFVRRLPAPQARMLADDPKVPVAVRRMLKTRLGG